MTKILQLLTNQDAIDRVIINNQYFIFEIFVLLDMNNLLAFGHD